MGRRPRGWGDAAALLLALSVFGFQWRVIASKRAEAAQAATRLHDFLGQRLAHDAADRAALSDARDLDNYLSGVSEWFQILPMAVGVTVALVAFLRTDLWRRFAKSFVRVWTWRP